MAVHEADDVPRVTESKLSRRHALRLMPGPGETSREFHQKNSRLVSPGPGISRKACLRDSLDSETRGTSSASWTAMSALSKCIAIRVLIYHRATTSLPPDTNTNGMRIDHVEDGEGHYVSVKGAGTGPLFDRVLGRVIYALA